MAEKDVRLTGNQQGFYTDSMEEKGDSPSGIKERKVLVRRPDGQLAPLRPAPAPTAEVVAERAQSQLQYERMMRAATESSPEAAPRDTDAIVNAILQTGEATARAIRNLAMQQAEDAEVMRRKIDEQAVEIAALKAAPLVSLPVEETVSSAESDEEKEESDEEKEARELMEALLGRESRERRGKDTRSKPEKDISRILEVVTNPEAREQDRRDAAVEMKKWVRVLIENVNNGNLIFRPLPTGSKEEVLRQYESLIIVRDEEDPTIIPVSLEAIEAGIQELQNTVGIERYFRDVQELEASSDGMPTCGEEMLESLASKWGRGKYVTGGEAELISRDGIVNEKNVLDLFVDRATVVTANNPRGKVDFNRLIYFGNRIRTEPMDEALNNPEYLSRRTYEVVSNEAQRDGEGKYIVPEGEETIEVRETRAKDPRFDKLMNYAYYNFLYYYVVAHNRERSHWRIGKAQKDSALGALRQMFNVEHGNDFAARNGLEMLWGLPNPENKQEVSEWLDGKEQGSFGLLGQRMINAMDHLLEAHPPVNTKDLDQPVVIERLPNGNTMFEEVLGETGVKAYYRVLSEGLLSRNERYKKLYTDATAQALEDLATQFTDERALRTISAKVNELRSASNDEYLPIQLDTNSVVGDIVRRFVHKGKRSEIENFREVYPEEVEDVIASVNVHIKNTFISSILNELKTKCDEEALRARGFSRDVHSDLVAYRENHAREYEGIGAGLIKVTADNFSGRDMEGFAKAAALAAKVPWEQMNPSYDKNLPGPALKEVSDMALVEAGNAGVELPQHVKEYAGRFYLNMRGWMFYEAKNHSRAIFPFITSAMHTEQDVTERKARGGRKGGGIPTVRPWFKHMVAPYAYSIGVIREVNGEEQTWSLAEVLRGSKEMKIDPANPPRNFTTPIEAENDWLVMLEGQINTKELVGKGVGIQKLINEQFVVEEDQWDDLVNGNLRAPTRSGYSTYVGPWYYNQKIRAVDPEEKMDASGRSVRILNIKTQDLLNWQLSPIVVNIMKELAITGKDEGIYIAALMGEFAYKISPAYKGKKINLEDFTGTIKAICTMKIGDGKPLMTPERYDKMLTLLNITDAKGNLNRGIYEKQIQGNYSWLERQLRGLLTQ